MIGWIQDGDTTFEVAVSRDPSAYRLAPSAWLDLAWLARDPCNVEVMRNALLAAGSHQLRHCDGPHDLAGAFEDLLSKGQIELRPVGGRPIATVFPNANTATDDEVEALVELAQTHFIEFRFVDPRGNPIGGVPYVLHDPAGEQSEGTLGRDGRIRRDGVPDGTWAAELSAVADVRWETEAAACDEVLVLHARVTGCPDGTPVTVRVFREFAETDDDVIDELSAEVVGQAVEVEWTYDYAGEDRRANEQGEARFIAEVAIDDARWAKTLTPVRVGLKTILAADWSCARCARGATVQLAVEVSGYVDGTEAEVSIVRRKPDGGTEEHEALGPLPIVGGRIDLDWIAPDAVGELRFEVEIDDGVLRAERSDWLWVAAR